MNAEPGRREPAEAASPGDLADRLAAVRRRIVARTDRTVELVCVTKGHPASVAASAIDAGCSMLGESYAQELVAKAAALAGAEPPRTASWHFVGRLQRNKVRQVAPLVSLWHTIDRRSLADEVARRAPGAQVLVQLDLAGIEGRGGCPPAEATALVRHCEEVGLVVLGLMGVGPPGPVESARPGFRVLVDAADRLSLPVRCIGMSADLEVAIDEGSTMVRVGRAIVGERPTPAPRATDS